MQRSIHAKRSRGLVSQRVCRAAAAAVVLHFETLEQRVLLSATALRPTPAASAGTTAAASLVQPRRPSRSIPPASNASVTLSITPSITWTNPAGGDWSVASNWSTGVVPAATDDVSIDVPGSVTITVSQGTALAHSVYSADALTINGGVLNVTTTIQVDNTFTLSTGTLKSATVVPGAAGQGLTLIGGTLNGVTLISDGVLASSGVTVTNGLTVDGTLTLGDSTSYGYLDFNGSQTLGGSGTVVFSGSGPYDSLALSSGTLTIGSGLTVTGQTGYVGYSPAIGGTLASISVANQGMIAADVSGGTLTVYGTANQNTGTLKAINGATLSLTGSLTNSGTLSIDGTSFLTGGTITGGTITTQTGAELTNVTLDGVTVSGSWQVAGATSVTVLDGLTLGGTLSLGGTGNSNYGYLVFSGSQTLGGTGTVMFTGTGPYNALGLTTGTLTIGANVTVTGQTGYIGYNPAVGGSVGSISIVNQGTIHWAAGTSIQILSTLTNNGTITVDPTAIMSTDGTIVGGTITTQTGAEIYNTTLDGVTVSGNWQVAGANTVTVKDGLILGGTLSLGATGSSNYGYLTFSGSQTLGGTGTVMFVGSGPYSALAVTTGTLTIGPNITVAGQTGYIGYSPAIGGTLSAIAVINQGTIQWTAGTNIGILSTLTNNGTITIDPNGVMDIGGTIKGGTITTQTGAEIYNTTLDGVTVSGNWQVVGTGFVTVLDGLTLSGVLDLGGTGSSNYGYLDFNGSQTLGGTGTVVFVGPGPYDALGVSTGTLTIGANVTVHGQGGYIGYTPITGGSGSIAIVNQGTISADSSGQTITIGGSSTTTTLQNDGAVNATQGTINVVGGSLVNSGTLSAGPTGSVAVSGSFSQAAGASLSVVLGGATAGLYGQVTASGAATLDGTLNVSEANGFSPGTGNIFTVVSDSSETGQFSDYSGLALSANSALQPGYNPASMTLTTVTSTTIAPDLRVTNLSINPANPLSSQNVTINWTDANFGNGATGASWTDRVVVTDTTTSQTLVSADVQYDATVSGSLAAGGSSARSYSFMLPNGPAGVGNLQISVTTDFYNTIAEYYPGNVGESNNTTTVTAASTLSAYPDLQVSGLSFSPMNPRSGQSLTIDWNDINTGTGATSGNWTDQIQIVNTTTSQTLVVANIPYNATSSGSISAGGTSPQLSYTFQLPDGSPGVGNLQITVATNINGTLYEYNASGTATTNNSATVTAVSTLAPGPDLAVQNLTITPAMLQSGGPMNIAWDDANVGQAATSGSWTDLVTVTNTTTSQTIYSQNVYYNSGVAGNGDVTAGSSRHQAVSFTLPNFAAGAGALNVTVTTNAYGNVFESQLANNTASTTVTSTLAPYPDLQVSAVSGPGTGLPGAQVSVTYTLSNTGSSPASGPWLDQINLANADGSNPVPIGSSEFDGTIPAGQNVVRTVIVTLPSYISGTQYFQVVANTDHSLLETSFTNNTAVASQPISLAAALVVSLASHSISEGAGTSATTGTVTRNTDTSQPLMVTLASSNTSSATVPQTLIIPAGQASAVFSVNAIDDGLVDGSQTATVTASAGGFASGTDTLTITNIDAATLGVSVNNSTFSEAASNPAATGTVTRNTPTTSPLVVSLLSDEYQKATVPMTVTIAAGQTSATFPITAVNDGLIDGPTVVNISASAAGMIAGTAPVTVTDVNVPTLGLTLADATISESAPSPATTGTVTLNRPQSTIVAVTLTSSDTTAATIPTVVYVPMGQTSVSFNLTALDDGIADADKNVIISAQVTTYTGIVLTQGMATANLKVLNADGAALTLSLPVSAILAGGQTTATVTRNTADTSSALVVTLASSNTTHATVPATVTIPVGSASTTFTVMGVDDHLADGLQYADISASAGGFATAVTTLGVTSVDLPDLVVTSVTAPVSGYDNGTMQVSWTVTNEGLYLAEGSWQDAVYLDLAGGTASAAPVDVMGFNGSLPAGQSYTQTDTMAFPSIVGQYTPRVVTDANQNIQELSYSNNSATGNTINDQASYHATVTTTATTVSSGTPIPLGGVATLTSNGQPAANVPVAVRVLVNGTQRVFTVTTDASGNYSLIFQPLQYEAGQYTVAADDPDVVTSAAQASFQIVGLSAAPGNANVSAVPNTPLSGSFTLTNLSAMNLTGLSAVAQGNASDIGVTFSAPSQIAGNGTATLGYTITATGSVAEDDAFFIHVTTAQGATLDIPIDVTVVPLTPRLSTNPGALNSGMLVGSQTLLSFTITNNGGSPTGDLTVNLPATPYMVLSSAATIPSLVPGASSVVTLTLNPAATLPLQQYTGNIVINNATTGISVPFTLNAISSAVGAVSVLVDDDFTFQESGSPHVAGATVSLLDPYDNTTVIATGTTDSTGSITFPSVPAGPYLLQVQADQHSSYDASINVVPGITNSQEVFIARQFVTYTWVVQQTTIEDTYEIQLDTSFATEVPAPVLTMNGPTSIPTLQPGQSGTFNLTVTNHGLIAAQGVELAVPTDPEYTFTPLTATLGVVPANSTVIVPVTVSRAAVAMQSSQAAGLVSSTSDESGGSCTLTVALRYYYQCGGNDVYHDFFEPVNIPFRDCSAQGVANSLGAAWTGIYDGGGIGGGTGGGGGGGSGGGAVQYILDKLIDQFGRPTAGGDDPPAVAVPSNCNPCLEHIGANLAQIAFDANPVGAFISSVAGTYNNVQNALNGSPGGLIKQGLGALKSAASGSSGEASPDLSTAAGSATASGSGGAAAAGKALLPIIKKLWGYKDQILDVINACTPLGGGGWFGSSEGTSGGGSSGGISADSLTSSDVAQPPAYDADPTDIAALETMYDRINAILNAETALFGGNSDWLATTQTATLQQWVTAFVGAIDDSSDGGQTITPAETATLMSTTLPDTVTSSDAMELITKWNRSVQYWSQGIFTVAQVPNGQSTDFFDDGTLNAAFTAANNAINETIADGYADPVAELQAIVQTALDNVNGSGTCATVKLQIDQTATLSRSAFTGTLSITNNNPTSALTDIEINLQVTDANGNPVSGAFYISSPTLGGGLTAIDGTGMLASLATGTVQFTFIPTDSAAANGPTLYHLGGTFSFVDPGDLQQVTTPMFPATITVYPQAQLQLNYFLQKDVIGDNPFTPQVEPSEPAVLGLLVTNVGKGTANDLAISTSQPQIVENQKGLLDTFSIVGTQVGSAQQTPSLNANFGNVQPGQTVDADFLLLSSLQGIFSDFSASFTHFDSLGGLETSLISSVQTHTLIHAGDFAFANSTGEQDYLAEDAPNSADLPDTIYFSDGTTAPVNIATNISSTPTATGTYTVTANVTSGWDYLQLPDPGAGYTLYKVVRSDGLQISVPDQAWTTDRTFDASGNSTTNYQLHILDDNSTGSYTVYYKPAVATPPALVSLSQISSPQTGAVSSVDVTFNEPIDPTTFSVNNVSLSLNGSTISLTNSSVSIVEDSTTQFTIGGLAALTGGNGNYTLTVSAASVNDGFGDLGSGMLSTSWATGTGVPVIASVGSGNPALRNTALSSVQVVLSEPIVPSSFDYHALSLTLNGGGNVITSAVTVTQLDSTTYQINGLSSLTSSQGNYVLTVNATGLTDGTHTGVGSLAATWVTDLTPPTIVSITPSLQSPRDIVVPDLDVTFSEPVDPSTFTYQALTYSKQGGANLIDSAVGIQQLSPVEFELTDFNNLVAPIDGTYTFTFSAAGVKDLAGNVGTGSQSVTWVLDTTGPAAPTGLAISPDTGSSSTDGITDTGALTISGSVAESGLAVEVYDGQNQKLADAVVSGQSFSAALSLSPGMHDLRVYAVDVAANLSADTFLNVFIDPTPPTATFSPVVQTLPSTAVASAQFTFAKAIDPTTLTTGILSLTFNGGSNLITGGVTLKNVSGNIYEIDGLNTLDASPGNYVLSINMSAIRDIAGNIGTGGPTVTWQVLPAVQQPAFSALTSTTAVTFGAATLILSGSLTAPSSAAPAAGQMVGVTLNAVTVNATLNASGQFAASFNTTSLPASSTPYAVSYAFAGSTGFSAASDGLTTTVLVSKAASTLSLPAAPTNLVYTASTSVTGWVVPALAGVLGATAPSGTPMLAYYAGTSITGSSLSSSPIHPGTYTVVATYPGDGNYLGSSSQAITFIIQQATPTLAAPTIPGSIVYDGQTDVVTSWASGANLVQGVGGFVASATLAFYNGLSGTGTPLTSLPVNAGNYSVVVSFTGNSDFLAAALAPIPFTIARAPSTTALSSPPPSITADGTTDVTNWVTATVTGVAGAPAPSGLPVYTYYLGYFSSVQSLPAPLASSPTTAGSYTVLASYAGNSNYLPSNALATFNINPAANLTATMLVNGLPSTGTIANTQRSEVTSLVINFSAPVTLSAGAITLTDQDPANPFGSAGASVPFTLAVSNNGMTYTLTFSGTGFISRGALATSLPNGHYILAVNFGSVSSTGAAVPTGTQTLKFHRLYGDITNAGYVTTVAARADASASNWASYQQFLDNDGAAFSAGFDSADSSALVAAETFVTGTQEQSLWNQYNG